MCNNLIFHLSFTYPLVLYRLLASKSSLTLGVESWRVMTERLSANYGCDSIGSRNV